MLGACFFHFLNLLFHRFPQWKWKQTYFTNIRTCVYVFIQESVLLSLCSLRKSGYLFCDNLSFSNVLSHIDSIMCHAINPSTATTWSFCAILNIHPLTLLLHFFLFDLILGSWIIKDAKFQNMTDSTRFKLFKNVVSSSELFFDVK